MKVLLLEHPRTISQERCNDIANTPLASCLLSGSIAGVIQDDGHDVSIIEGYLDNLSYQEIEEQVKDVSPGLLGVNMVSLNPILDFLEK
jgi:anaerobic magnesium-protoporphyrin IX monomethyl ester cyclase